MARPYQVHKGKDHPVFCSKECYWGWGRPKQRATAKCRHCGKMFTTTKGKIKFNQARYCSRDCSGKAHEARKSPIITFTCQNCGNETSKKERPGHELKYCSMRCFREYAHEHLGIIDKECKHCGEIFEANVSQMKFHPVDYCSKKCYEDYRSKKPKNCIKCGKEFVYSHRSQKYCSPKCMGADRLGERNPLFKGMRKLNCLHCGSEFEEHPCRADPEGVGLFCSKLCMFDFKTVHWLLPNGKLTQPQYANGEFGGRVIDVPPMIVKDRPERVDLNMIMREGSGAGILRDCLLCSRSFLAMATNIERGGGIYCSTGCYQEGRRLAHNNRVSRMKKRTIPILSGRDKNGQGSEIWTLLAMRNMQ